MQLNGIQPRGIIIMEIKKIFPSLGIFLLIFFLIYIVYSINSSDFYNDTNNFCKSSWRNETFLQDFTNDDPPRLKICLKDEDYCRCLHENLTYDQKRFTQNCGWFQTLYLLTLAQVGLVAISLALLFMLYGGRFQKD